MSLSGSIQIGRSALTAAQAAIQVAGNNLANAATPGYTRQVARLTPEAGVIDGSGISNGRGVRVTEVRRQIDTALQGRLEDAVSREQGASISSQILSQIESILNELSGSDLSSELTKFFNAFSELANNPGATETRAVVIEQGVSLAAFMRGMRSDLATTQRQIESRIDSTVRRANDILDEIASLNASIPQSEQGRSIANELRDRRDALVGELSQLIEVSTIEQPNGAIDVLVGSTPIILAGVSRGLSYVTEAQGSDLVVKVQVTANQEDLRITSGTIGGLLREREGSTQRTIDDLDALAANLVFEVNRLHSSGKPSARLEDLTGWRTVATADQALAFNDPDNATFAALPIRPRNGSFTVIVTDAAGNRTLNRIDVDLDGINATGAPGFGDDTSLADLAAALNGVPNLNAQITPSGALRVFTDNGFDVSFANDTSGALAVLGISAFFRGDSAGDIAVVDEVRNDPLRLAAGADPAAAGGTANSVALAIAALADTPADGLGGLSVTNAWLRTVERVGSEGAAAQTNVEATRLVRESLEGQRAAISGVSVDEESVNLLTFQRQYQGAARFLSVVDEMLQTLLSLV